jgi:hypothetical protein
MLEVIVVLLCLGDYECGEASRAYSKTPKGIIYTQEARKKAQRYMTREQMTVLGTFIAGATNQKAKLRLYKGLTFEGNRDNVIMVYKYDF